MGTSMASWLDEHWDPGLTVREWWGRLACAGLSLPQLPESAGGRGWSREQVVARDDLFARRNVVAPPTGLGVLMGAPVVAGAGTSEQVRRLVPPLAAGVEVWCQLFSEPGAGSDLAGVSTRAERDGDEWVVTGQKVWTSGADVADRGMLIARTDWDVPKHRGLTYFVIPMDQPGVEVRPLRQMNGEAHFSEVFLDGARVRDADRIGDVGGGWSVALATLAYERAGLSDERHAGVNVPAGERNGLLDRMCADVLAHAADRPAGAPDDPASSAALIALAKGCGRASDHVVRQRLAAVWSLEAIAEWTRGRVQAEVSAGREAGPGAATGKLAWTTRLALVRDLCLELLGPAGMLDGPDAPDGGRMQRLALSIPSASIAGGSDEIQRNIIGERVLGLPKDVAVDRDLPFREVRR